MSMQTLALAFLAATTIGGLAWVFIYPSLSGQRKAESRRASIARSDAPARQAEKSQRSRREQVEGSLKDLDARRKKEKSVPLTTRLAQAGLGSWTPQKFWIVSGISGAVGFVLAFMIGGNPLGAAVMAFGTGLGLRDFANFQSRVDEKIARLLFGGAEQVGHGRHLHGRWAATSASSTIRRVGNVDRNCDNEANRGAHRDLSAAGIVLFDHPERPGAGLDPRDLTDLQERAVEKIARLRFAGAD
jgi:ElaB/YqjD/DUF883 family membrane-anchored ribosome-binding protein